MFTISRPSFVIAFDVIFVDVKMSFLKIFKQTKIPYILHFRCNFLSKNIRIMYLDVQSF